MEMNVSSVNNARVSSNAWEVLMHTSLVFTQTVSRKALTWVTVILSVISLGLRKESITMFLVV